MPRFRRAVIPRVLGARLRPERRTNDDALRSRFGPGPVDLYQRPLASYAQRSGRMPGELENTERMSERQPPLAGLRVLELGHKVEKWQKRWKDMVITRKQAASPTELTLGHEGCRRPDPST
jgi:hypothetical protein